jgi:hypothetical protein
MRAENWFTESTASMGENIDAALTHDLHGEWIRRMCE